MPGRAVQLNFVGNLPMEPGKHIGKAAASSTPQHPAEQWMQQYNQIFAPWKSGRGAGSGTSPAGPPPATPAPREVHQ